MPHSANGLIDWEMQARQLRAHLAQPEPIPAHETLLAYSNAHGCIQWKNTPAQSPSQAEQSPCVGVLRHYGLARGVPVLLVPGATAWRGTFFQPDGGLVRALLDARFDVWTLDWRGTKVITDIWRKREDFESSKNCVPTEIADMHLQRIADGELAAAVCKIAGLTKQPPSIIGHCIGAAATALAIARKRIKAPKASNQFRPAIVLSTIGLFFRGPVDSWLRANERLDDEKLEQWYVYAGEPSWPDSYEAFYGLWAKTPFPHCDLDFCRRMSSLIGAPFRPDDIGYLHDDEHAGLRRQFGLLPLSLLGDIAQSVRRGMVDIGEQPEPRQAAFGGFRLTLMTGSENQLWHRDSIDRMYEWLKRHDAGLSVEKRIFERYGHQDLWWSPQSGEPGGVYDYVIDRLR